MASRFSRGRGGGDAESTHTVMAPAGDHLALISGREIEGQQHFFPLRAEVTTLGRSPDCDVHILDPAVSRDHAEIRREGGALLIVHKSAVNPTLVNGRSVTEPTPIADGDEIQLANRVVLRVNLESAARPAPTQVITSPGEEPAPAAPPEPEPQPEPAAQPEPQPESVAQPEPRPEPAAQSEPQPTPEPARAEPAAPAPSPPEEPAPPPAPRPDIPRDQIHVAIVGAGPAGLAATIQAASSGVAHTVLERGKLANTIEKYQKGKWVMDEPPRLSLQEELAAKVGFQAGVREDILTEWNRAVAASGANLKVGPEYELKRLEGSIGGFTLTCKGGEQFRASHVVLSIGVQGNLRTFGVEGDDLPHVTYQLDDPAAYTGKRIVVVGVGDAGIENALALIEHDNEVSLVNRAAEIDRAKARNRTLAENAVRNGEMTYYVNTRVDHFEPGAVVFKTDNGELRVEADLVIGRLGAIPPRRFLEEIGVEFPSEDRESVPEVSGTYESNVPGLHIIGALAGYPLIKNCMNQGYEVIEHIVGNAVTPADEPVLREKLSVLPGSVSDNLDLIRRQIPIFAPLTTIQLREFLFDSEVRTLEAGEVVYERNDYSNSFFTLVDGSVQSVAPASDIEAEIGRSSGQRARERTLTYQSGDFFGEASLLSGRRRSSTVTTLSRCVLIEAPRTATNKLIKSVEEVRRVLDATFVSRTLEELVPSTPAAERQALAETAEIRTYNAGERLFSEGDEPDGLHLVRRGSVTISQDRDGRDTVVQYLQAGNYLGELALLAPNRLRSASVTATVYTETVLLPTSAIVPFLERHPEVRREFEQQETRYAVEEAARDADQPRGTVMFLMKETGAHEATDLLLIDESLCIRCNNCEKACADTHDGVSRLDREAGPTYETKSGSQLHVPTACQHCEFPKCMEECPPDALRRDTNGEVYILTDKCIGCGNCVANCPYDVIQMATVEEYRPRGVLWGLLFGARRKSGNGHEEEGTHVEKAAKCDLCKGLPERRGGGPRAACAASCPTGALVRVNPRAFVDEIIKS
jgi:CRP-like cAMP-binding protein/Fe-S-cluster-containing dehydrogenase component/thioredoxin reductase/pSer/pThr/pTyr-binding forkhead associated (FHA) protein